MALESDEMNMEWDGVQPPTKGGNRGKNTDGISLFMKLEPREEPYRFRLACTPIKFRRHRWAFKSLRQWPISPATEPTEKDLDVAWTKGKYMPSMRFAAFVFDRDTNRLRIIEDGADVFGPIGNHGHITKVNPASATKGWDWICQVSVNKDKQRQYQTTIDTTKGATPFTEAEVTTLENPKFQREELMTRYFVKATAEEIKDLYEQLPESARVNQKNDGKGAKPAQTARPAPEQAPKVAQAAKKEEPSAEPKDEVKTATKAAAPVAKPVEKVAEKPAEQAPTPDFLDEKEEVPAEPIGDEEDAPAKLF